MTNTRNRCWFICLLMIGIYALKTHSYGDFESMYSDNDENESEKVTFQSYIENMNGRHRVRRAVGDSTMLTYINTITTPISNSTNSMYVITSYIAPGITIQASSVTTQSIQITSVSSTASMTTYSMINGTYIITGYNSATTLGITQFITSTSITIITTPSTCNNGTYITLSNGTCVSRESAIEAALNILNSTSANDTSKANAISSYISAVTNANISLNASNTLTIGQLDGILGSLSITNYSTSTNDTTIIVTKPQPCNNSTTVIGTSFQPNNGATVIDTLNSNNVTNSPLTAAGIVNLTQYCNVTSFSMLIINNPTLYQNIDNTSNKTLASSIIMSTINEAGYAPQNIVINLYFEVLKPPNPTENAAYLCTFYDTQTSQWNQSGCSAAVFNTRLNRYECNCNHLTSFALIWLPKPSQPSSLINGRPDLDAQDKASIVFQVLSIVCFLGIVIHGITVRIMNPTVYTQSMHLLPLISFGITMLLFVFFIALGLTVYNRNTPPNTNIETTTQQRPMIHKNLAIELNSRADAPPTNSTSSFIPCLPNEHALMFIVYFFIIFMFCAKTSVSYYNYRHYVQMFPLPTPKTLSIALVICFIIALFWMIIAAGLNSNPSNQIAEIFLYKICWFSPNVIHYFLTIPICIFLALNLIMFIPVAKYHITQAGDAQSDREKYLRRQKCIYILLLSGVTQGFGWLFGPLILVASPKAADVLGWFFIIFNGLEGVWAILLYLVIRNEGRNRRGIDYAGIELPDIVPEFRPDDADDRIGNQLRYLKSESPRNSFTNFSDSQPHHRPYQSYNDDRLM